MEIFIGQQTGLTVSVEAPANAKVVFPSYKRSQYITPGVEVLEQTESDSVKSDGQKKFIKKFVLTSFDEKLYAIPPVKVKVNGRTYSANQLALKVLTVEVDTAHADKFFPPKDVQDNPFQWSEWAGIFWLSLIIVVLGVLLFYLVVRLKQNKPIITHIRIVKKLPPHQKALNAIDKLKREKMSASEDQKTYYTMLTDTLRQYIEERFGFNAKEMTSSEILYRLQQNGDKEMIDELSELFQTADLVKFAKYSTLLNENDLNLVNAINFIDRTKVEGQPTEERIVPKLSDDDKRTRNSRITIKSVIWAVSAIIIVIFVYVVYHIYLLMI